MPTQAESPKEREERLRRLRKWYAQQHWIAKATTAHIDLMEEQIHEDEEWAIEQVVHCGSIAPEASTHSNYENHDYEYEAHL